MIGKYKGYYAYDSQKMRSIIKHEVTFFFVEITEFHDGQFRGFVEDDIFTGGAPGKGIIHGKKNGNEIMFVKEMPRACFVANGEKRIYDRKHPKIRYKGTMTDGKMGGVWKIKFNVFMTGLIILVGAKTTGTWQMEKCANI